MSQVVDISAGDPTPELSQTSLIDAVKVINKFGFNVEIPAAGVNGAIVMRRNVTIASPGMTTVPAQVESFGAKLSLTHGALRLALLQQSVDLNDERLYLINNASPTAGSTYTGGFVYDKAGAAASYYMQRSGEHTFATAPIGGAVNGTVTFTARTKIDANGITIPEGRLAIQNSVINNAAFITGVSTGNNAAFAISGVNTADGFINGSLAGDTAFRTEAGNLVMGALAGTTIIGTSTRKVARFNTNGKVLFPGVNAVTNDYGSLTVGGGVTAIVGTGSDVADVNKSFWIYKNGLSNDFNGGGIQYNNTNGLDIHVGNNAAWLRIATFHTTGRTLFGGAVGATPIGDVHINQQGADTSGSLSLTGQGGASYILLGNRDSLGTAGPSVIAASNRRIQFGVGDSFFTRGGGTFTEFACFETGSLGIGVSNPSTYGPMAVVVTNGNGVAQVVMALKSPATVATGALAGGFGMYWGNNVFVGNRAVSFGDANNAGLAFMVGAAGVSNEAGRFSASGDLTVRGSTISLGSVPVSVLGCNASSDTYLRGGTIQFQNAAANVTWMSISSTLITHQIDAQMNGNLTVNGTIISSRQMEKSTDKVVAASATFDWNTTSLWVCSGATANFTANFTNMNTAIGQAVTVSLILQQGSSGYWPSAVQINGTAVTVKWAGGMAPVPTPNNIDLFQFTFIRTTSSTWIVLGSATPYV